MTPTPAATESGRTRFQITDRGLFSAVEFAAGFDTPVSFLHGPFGSRMRVALADLCHDLPAARASLCPFTRSLAEIIGHLDASPLGRALLAQAADDGVTIGQDLLLPAADGYFYAERGHIDLGRQEAALQMTEKGLAQYAAALITALRRAGHDVAGHTPGTHLRPRDFADHDRLLAADAEAVLHQAAWELRGAGHTYLWRALLAGDDGDIATVFEESVREDSQSQFNGSALKAAFNQWFACRARIARADHRALERLDAALLRCHGQAAAARFAAEPLNREGLECIGLLPDGRNYLASCIFTCAWYAGFDDDANRRHLAHIEQEIIQLAVFLK